MLGRLLDRQADWLRHTFGVQAQLRLGVLLFDASIPLFITGFFVDEPFLVYQMSAGALNLGGLGLIITAETLAEVAETDQ